MNAEQKPHNRFTCLRRILFVLAIVALLVLICTSINQNLGGPGSLLNLGVSFPKQLGGALGGGLNSTVSALSPFPSLV